MTASEESPPAGREAVKAFRDTVDQLRTQIGQVIVGNEEVIDGVLTCMLADSHVLLEGVPGLGKTMLVRTIAQAMNLEFSRIQFTPDLMPADIIGTTVIEEAPGGKHAFEFRPGPVFANIVLADEINRATPKTQSALLEAMQEKRVTVGRTTHKLGPPYMVLATQNPLEMEGTYPLPEAQLDRFFFKLEVPFPSQKELHTILDRTTTGHEGRPEAVASASRIVELQRLVRTVPVAPHVQDFGVRVLLATHPNSEFATSLVKRYVRIGASPRGAQAILLAARIQALLDGRFAAACEDIRKVCIPALRHRMLLSFEGEAEGIKTVDVLQDILERLPESVD